MIAQQSNPPSGQATGTRGEPADVIAAKPVNRV
jgi:hypothetical protein